jgi:hypothetical protein
MPPLNNGNKQMLVDNNPNTREHKHYYGYVNDTDK